MLLVDLIRRNFEHLHFVNKVENLILRFILQSLLPHSHLMDQSIHIIAASRVLILAAALFPRSKGNPTPGTGPRFPCIQAVVIVHGAAHLLSECFIAALCITLVQTRAGSMAETSGGHGVARLVRQHGLAHAESARG